MNARNFALNVSIWLFFSAVLTAQPRLELPVFATGLRQPVDITHAGDSRLFVVEKAGRIRIVNPDGSVRTQSFLDISDRVRSSGSEQGLLGLAFHPDYAANGYFFVNYTNADGDTRVARFRVSAADPNRADAGSEKILLRVEQPYFNHNAGDLAFGPDGYLYVPLGDGGSGGDPQNYAQTRRSLLGKLLRIDVDRGDPYAIPDDNPFLDDPQTPDEVWALGLRNPWRISFDRQTGALWIGDVGQNRFEEINYQPPGSRGGQNYGWRCYEGFEAFNTANCPPRSETTLPAHAYGRDNGACSVTGGFVYRGAAYPGLQGYYIYADYCNGRIWGLRSNQEGGFSNGFLLDFDNNELASFGEDRDGELYAAGIRTGNIYRVADQCASLQAPRVSFNADILSVPDTFASYQWRRDGTPIAGATSPAYAPNDAGAYSVEVGDRRGCRTVSEVFTLTSAARAIGIRWWQVTPNPFRDVLRLEVELTEPAAFLVKIYDAGGRVVRQDRLPRDQRWVREYSLTDLESGLYFISLERGEQRVVQKLLKSR